MRHSKVFAGVLLLATLLFSPMLLASEPVQAGWGCCWSQAGDDPTDQAPALLDANTVTTTYTLSSLSPDSKPNAAPPGCDDSCHVGSMQTSTAMRWQGVAYAAGESPAFQRVAINWGREPPG